MAAHLHSDSLPPNPTVRRPWRYRFVLWGFVAIAAFFLVAEHTAHLLGVLPYLLILACPLMHFFMHRGHDHHGRHDAHDNSQRDTQDRKSEASHQHDGRRP